MKIVDVAKFFDCMRRSEISFSVDDVATNFKYQFGVGSAFPTSSESYKEAVKERDGTFLSVYVIENSLDEDVLIDAIRTYMKGFMWWRFESPNMEAEFLYIIKLEEK